MESISTNRRDHSLSRNMPTQRALYSDSSCYNSSAKSVCCVLYYVSCLIHASVCTHKQLPSLGLYYSMETSDCEVQCLYWAHTCASWVYNVISCQQMVQIGVLVILVAICNNYIILTSGFLGIVIILHCVQIIVLTQQPCFSKHTL